MLNKYPKYKIINLDKLSYSGNRENLKDLEHNKNYFFVKGDICDEKAVQKVANDVDSIINFAAETHVDRSIKSSRAFLKTNIFGSHILLEAALKFHIKKYIQVSTDEVYGSIDKGSFNELSNLNPSSPYSASKASADFLVNAYFMTHSIPVMITRSSNNFGPYQYPEKLIPLLITNLLEGRKIPLYGNGLNVRDWTYVLDNCKAMDLILHHGKIGEIYNIGARNEKINLEIAKIILKELGKDDSYIEFVKDRKGHDKRYSLDSSKLKALGWKPDYDFDEALKSTIRWYIKNKNWWQKIKSSAYKKYYKKQYGNI